MPTLIKLNVDNFRNIRSASFEPGENVNLIFGSNGSGKTSLLEAISVLAHGRSFRTHKFRRLINHQEREFTLFSQVKEQHIQNLGITRKYSGELTIRIDGTAAYSAAEMAQCLPLLIMNASSFQLLEGSSKIRRQFFDWIVFHVKHDFKNVWKMYTKCVKHRNTLLRRDKITVSDLAPWNEELHRLGGQIEKMREEMFASFSEAFHDSLNRFDFAKKELAHEISIEYVSGWKETDSYKDQLESCFERDRQLGYTTIGSQKSDIKLLLGKIPAVDELSRGQQKSLIVSLYLAAAKVLQILSQRNPVFVLDDLPAELDKDNLSIVGKELTKMASQVFVTAIDPGTLMKTWQLTDEQTLKMFHVEHGEVTPASI